MQTVQKKAVSGPKTARPQKRIVKMDGNVAYINSGFAQQKTRPTQARKTVARPAEASRPKSAVKPRETVKLNTAARPRETSKLNTAAKPKTAVKPKQRTSVASTLIIVFIVFCALAVLISRYLVVCSVGAENNTIEDEIAAIESEINTLQIDIELKDNLEYVLDTAQAELGMTYPSQEQKQYIDINS